MDQIESRTIGEVYFRRLVRHLNQTDKGKALLEQIRQNFKSEYTDYCCRCHKEISHDVLALSDYFYRNPDQADQIKKEYAPNLSPEDCRLDERKLQNYLIKLRRALNNIRYNWVISAAKVIAAKWSKDADYKNQIWKPVSGWIPHACEFGPK